MIYFKVITQVLTCISGLIALLLDYKWHDKRRKIFKQSRNGLIILTVLSLIAGVIITVNDEKAKNSEITSLKKTIDTAKSTLADIKANGDTLKYQIKPFLDLAVSKYPNLSLNEALDSLKLKLKTLDSNFFYGNKKISQLNDKAEKLEKKIKIISSLEFRMSVDEITSPTPLTNKETSAGIQSVVGLFDQKNNRYRFVTDFQFGVQQIFSNKNRITFIYKPEDPDQILGKTIDMLSKIKTFVCNFSKLPEIFGKPNNLKTHLISCALYLNGIKINIFQDYKLENGRLYQGQINIPISNQFSKIEATYKEYIDNETK